jgi:hypothetical protein
MQHMTKALTPTGAASTEFIIPLLFAAAIKAMQSTAVLDTRIMDAYNNILYKR